MQYHLNGFRAGDPRRAARSTDRRQRGNVDVAIIGCGPAGLALATQLALIPGIETRIFDKRSGPLLMGQADGIACRSLEMFQAFGFADQVLAEAYWVNETCFWRPGPDGAVQRADRIQDVEDDLSEMPHVILSQARIQDFFLERMASAPGQVRPDYSRAAVNMRRIDGADYPIEVTFDCSDAPGQTEIVRARYLVGCDGAHSTVRQWLGHELAGESARQLWGVMDVLCVTDFPDIRLKCAIQSADQGSMLIIPREGGYLVRLYIELDHLRGDERAADRNVTPEMLADRARAILAPYTLEVKEVAWCSAYEIGQRACDAFDDVPSAARAKRTPRVFVAGDACHTHSPKAGQGMNVSMADTYNLGWKLAAVIKGQSAPALLHSYSHERRAIAQELIDFDRDMARLFSKKPSSKAEAAQFQEYFQKFGRYTAGVETTYAPSSIVGPARHQELARGLSLGRRFHSAPVVRLADARPMQLAHVLIADGRWRLIAFADADDTGQAGGPIADLCDRLIDPNAGPIARFTPPDADIDAVIDLRAVFQKPHRDLEPMAMPALLRPRKGKHRLIDYEKVFCPDLKSPADIFDMRGIDRRRGALVVVRPDQVVAHILPLCDVAALRAFFDGVFVPQCPDGAAG